MPQRFKIRMWILVLLLSAAVSAGLVITVFRTTNVTAGPGQPDGIQPGGDRHNSYAWCQEVMRVNGVDYLYVGSNRDIINLVTMGYGLTDEEVQRAFGGDVATGNRDFRARLYRYRLDGTGNWELVFTSPSFPSPGLPPLFPAGSDVPFDLGYRGMANLNGDLYVVTLGTAYSRVLRFRSNGAPPEEVFRIPGGSLRAIDVFNNQLIVGTQNNLVFATSNPQVQAPVNLTNQATFTAIAGWTPIASNANLGNPGPSDGVGVWEFEAVGDTLYASLGQGHLVNATDQGFRLYKGRFAGPGSPGANAAGWVWTAVIDNGAPYPRGLGNPNNSAASLESFKGQLFIGTLMDVIGQTGQGTVFDNYTPCQIYRMDGTGKIDMVVGDTNAQFPTALGNYRAGFWEPGSEQLALPEPYRSQNYSLQPYLWWMEVHQNRLFVSTFDMRIFLRYLNSDFLTIMGVPQGTQTALLNNVTVINRFNLNPEGFDLFVSDDGVSFRPVTQNGFNDPFNYGGRTLQSTSEGLSVGTANPFYGCQVYRLKTEDVPENTGTSQVGAAPKPPESTGDGGGISCFVATAAFGSPLAPQLDVLRTFRDRFLLSNAPGRVFVTWYYEHGPAWAAYLNANPGLKPVVRMALYPVVLMAWLMVSGWALAAVPLAGLWWRRRRLARQVA